VEAVVKAVVEAGVATGVEAELPHSTLVFTP
jgi:hypothetical protein